MSIGPTDDSFEKKCFAYCGDDVCDCSARVERDLFIVPAEEGVEYEWKGISECLEAGLDVAKLMDEEGWVFVGGALRRPKVKSDD